MALIKDIYSRSFYKEFGGTVKKVLPAFDETLFIKKIYSAEFAGMEWKQRMNHTAVVLHQFLPEAPTAAAQVLRKIITRLRKERGREGGLEHIFLAEYIPRFMLDDYKTGIDTLEFVTQFISCEFAVRAFLTKYGDRMYKQMLSWSLHKSDAVRRLSTEGFRPRLPWGLSVPGLKADPSPVLPVLENLKADPSESVRRSVANNLNDIAKDHPALVLEIAGRWKGASPETDVIIRHGSRTLLKQGHAEILGFFGLSSKNLSVGNLTVLTPKVSIGEYLRFSFELKNDHVSAMMVRVEYGIYYLKSNGQQARKVFKVSEKSYAGKSTTTIQRQQSFKLITTRVFYPGKHGLSIIINGEEKARGEFVLLSS